jgi:hypothetical protein
MSVSIGQGDIIENQVRHIAPGCSCQPHIAQRQRSILEYPDWVPVHRHYFKLECLIGTCQFSDGFFACEHFPTLSMTKDTDGTDLLETIE